jgi:hypothetical protein
VNLCQLIGIENLKSAEVSSMEPKMSDSMCLFSPHAGQLQIAPRSPIMGCQKPLHRA